MHSRRALPQIALFACVGISLLLASTSAAARVVGVTATTVRTRTASGSGSSEAAVLRVFRALKIDLVVRTAGNAAQRVSVLSAVVPHKLTHAQPWALEIFIYPSSGMAAQAFDAGIGGWRNNGIPAARANNLIVTVVPKGREIGVAAPAFPMPQLVREALRALDRKSP